MPAQGAIFARLRIPATLYLTAFVTLGIILYNQGFVNWQYGSAAAVGVVILLLSLAFTIAQFSWQRRGGEAE